LPAFVCGIAGDILCTGFETTDVSWEQQDDISADAMLGFDSFARRGSRSLRGHLPKATGRRVANRNLTFSRESLYVRVFLHLPAKPPALVRVLVVLSADKTTGLELRVDKDGTLNNGGFTLGGPVAKPSATSAVSSGWTCLEWFASREGSKVWVGDKLISTLDLAVSMTPMGTLGVGPYYYNEATDRDTDAWFDDLVVSPSPVGCAR
jgi:hypothetical protein